MHLKHLFIFLGLCLTIHSTQAVTLIKTNRFQLDEGTSLSHETLVITTESQVDGIAEKDFYLLGVSNIVNGTFREDAWLGSINLVLSGNYGDDLRLFGQDILTRGQVTENLFAAGKIIQVGQESVVGEDALLLGSEVVVNGKVAGNTIILAQKATLSGNFAGDVRVVADDIVLMRGVSIDGDLIYSSDQELFIDNQMTVHGEVRQERARFTLLPRLSVTDSLYLQFAFFLAAVLCGMPFVGLFPRYTGLCVHLVRTQPWRCCLTGTMMLFLLPFLAVLVSGTLIGIPLGLLLLAILIGGVYLSKVIIALVIGSYIFRRRGYQSFFSVMLVLWGGLLFLYIADLLPILGDVVWLGTILLGLGSMTQGIFKGNTLTVKAPTETPPTTQA